MKTIVNYKLQLFLGLIVLVLGACATKLPETPQQIINESKAIVLAAKKTINQNLTDGFYTPAQAGKRLDEVEKGEKVVDDAQALLVLGKDAEAAAKATGARSALRALRSQVQEKK